VLATTGATVGGAIASTDALTDPFAVSPWQFAGAAVEALGLALVGTGIVGGLLITPRAGLAPADQQSVVTGTLLAGVIALLGGPPLAIIGAGVSGGWSDTSPPALDPAPAR
jgi:hypothetical protein